MIEEEKTYQSEEAWLVGENCYSFLCRLQVWRGNEGFETRFKRGGSSDDKSNRHI